MGPLTSIFYLSPCCPATLGQRPHLSAQCVVGWGTADSHAVTSNSLFLSKEKIVGYIQEVVARWLGE